MEEIEMEQKLRYELEKNKADVKQMVDDITTMIDKKYPGELARATIAFYIVNRYHEEYLKNILDTEIPTTVKEKVDQEIDDYFKQFDKKTREEIQQTTVE
jgi:hypothetical protein